MNVAVAEGLVEGDAIEESVDIGSVFRGSEAAEAGAVADDGVTGSDALNEAGEAGFVGSVVGEVEDFGVEARLAVEERGDAGLLDVGGEEYGARA